MNKLARFECTIPRAMKGFNIPSNNRLRLSKPKFIKLERNKTVVEFCCPKYYIATGPLIGSMVCACSSQGHSPRANKIGWIHISDFLRFI